MSLKQILTGFLFCVALGLAACGPLTPANPTGASPTSLPPSATAPATDTPTVEPTASSTPTMEATPSGPPVITAGNVDKLVPMPLTPPEFAQRLLWVGPGVALPDGLPPNPDLLAYTGSLLYPILLNPPSLGQPVDMPVPGRVLDFAPGLTSVAAVPDTNTGQVILYDMTGKELVPLGDTAAYGASYSADGSLLAVTSTNELAVDLYDTSSGNQVTRLTGFQTAAPVYTVGIVPGNRTIYWLARATLEFQDVQTGQMGQKLNYQDFILGHAFSPDGSCLALGMADKLLLYSVPDARQLAEVTLSTPVNTIAFSPDGQLLATNDGSGIQIWNAATLSPITALPGPNTFTGEVTFSPDGRYLVSQHENNVLEVWWVK